MKLAAFALALAACSPLPAGVDVTADVKPLIETAYGVYQALEQPRPRVFIADHTAGCPGQQFEYDGHCSVGVTIPAASGDVPLVFVAVPDEGPALWSRSFLAEGLMRATGVTSWTVDDKPRTDIEQASYWFSVSTIDEMGATK